MVCLLLWIVFRSVFFPNFSDFFLTTGVLANNLGALHSRILSDDSHSQALLGESHLEISFAQ